jgi:protein gp37
MAEHSAIEWTDHTWQVVTGCSVVSPGCTNCYAMRLAGTRLRNHPSRKGLTTMSKAGPVWNGTVRLNEEWLDQPLRWRTPAMIFVAAHGDLFHEEVPLEWIDRVFAVMALAPWHTFQVLSKRSFRMREYAKQWFERLAHLDPVVNHPTGAAPFSKLVDWSVLPKVLPNVWLGTSAEDQPRADERIPDLLATPAAVRFVSLEPLLGPIDLRNIKMGYATHLDALQGVWAAPETGPNLTGNLGWVIVGGESGPGARPMNPDWARSIRDQCAAAGVPYFFKQWGEYAPGLTGSQAVTAGTTRGLDGHRFQGTDVVVWKHGKKRAGRLLDGVEHNGMPGNL